MLMGAMPPDVGLTTCVVFPCCGFAGEGAFAAAFAVFATLFTVAVELDIFDETGTDPTAGTGSPSGGVSDDLENHVNGFQNEPPLFFVLCDLRNFRDLRILYLTRTFTCDHE
jgi:hypothetical protein